jgi:hypothetical protein
MNISPISSHISPWMMPATDSTQCYIPQAMMKKGHQTMVSCVAQTLSTSVELSCPIYIYIYITNATKMASEEVFHSNLCRQENGIAYRGMVLTITKSQRVLTDWWPVTIHWFHLPARNWRSSSRLFFFSSADCPCIYLLMRKYRRQCTYIRTHQPSSWWCDRQTRFREKNHHALC